MAPQTSTKLTYEDYAAIPADGRRHELIDGEHYVNPSPNTKHQLVSIRLASALLSFVEEHGTGHVFAALDVVLTQQDVVAPDITFVSTTRASIIKALNIQGAPDIVVEILSSNRRYDKRVKYEMYERARVDEYWIIDPDDEVVEVYRHDGRQFVRANVGDTLTSPLLPDFHLNVRDLFA